MDGSGYGGTGSGMEAPDPAVESPEQPMVQPYRQRRAGDPPELTSTLGAHPAAAPPCRGEHSPSTAAPPPRGSPPLLRP